jgi:hypothetical protein
VYSSTTIREANRFHRSTYGWRSFGTDSAVILLFALPALKNPRHFANFLKFRLSISPRNLDCPRALPPPLASRYVLSTERRRRVSFEVCRCSRGCGRCDLCR